MTPILARELRGRDGTVNAVVPKQRFITPITEMFMAAFGDDVRGNTVVLVDEVVDGGWGIGGEVVTLDKLTSKA